MIKVLIIVRTSVISSILRSIQNFKNFIFSEKEESFIIKKVTKVPEEEGTIKTF